MYRHSIDSTNSIHVNVLVVFANGCSVLCSSSGSSWLEIPVNRWCIRCTSKWMTSNTLRYKKAAIKATTHKQLQLKGPAQLRNIKSVLYTHGLYNFRQKNSRTFQGQLQFLSSKFFSVTLLSLTPFWTSYRLKDSAESFVIFPFSAMVDQFTFYFCTTFRTNTSKNDKSHWVWLAVDLKYRNSTWKKESEIRK